MRFFSEGGDGVLPDHASFERTTSRQEQRVVSASSRLALLVVDSHGGTEIKIRPEKRGTFWFVFKFETINEIFSSTKGYCHWQQGRPGVEFPPRTT